MCRGRQSVVSYATEIRRIKYIHILVPYEPESLGHRYLNIKTEITICENNQ